MAVIRKKATRPKAKKGRQESAAVREAAPAYGLTKSAFERLLKKAAQPVKKRGSKGS
jgi:hypothetical protein